MESPTKTVREALHRVNIVAAEHLPRRIYVNKSAKGFSVKITLPTMCNNRNSLMYMAEEMLRLISRDSLDSTIEARVHVVEGANLGYRFMGFPYIMFYFSLPMGRIKKQLGIDDYTDIISTSDSIRELGYEFYTGYYLARRFRDEQVAREIKDSKHK